jgi:hydrogenase maturation protease
VKHIHIGGVGNVLLGDDGIGPYVARTLEARYEFGDNVHVADLGTPGLDLIAHVSGMDALILVDAVKSGEPAGTVTCYRSTARRCGWTPIRRH